MSKHLCLVFEQRLATVHKCYATVYIVKETWVVHGFHEEAMRSITHGIREEAMRNKHVKSNNSSRSNRVYPTCQENVYQKCNKENRNNTPAIVQGFQTFSAMDHCG